MKTIGYLVPYFGTLPKNMQLWLKSCAANPTIDWILLTDDKTEYDFPKMLRLNTALLKALKSVFKMPTIFPCRYPLPGIFRFLSLLTARFLQKNLPATIFGATAMWMLFGATFANS